MRTDTPIYDALVKETIRVEARTYVRGLSLAERVYLDPFDDVLEDEL